MSTHALAPIVTSAPLHQSPKPRSEAYAQLEDLSARHTAFAALGLVGAVMAAVPLLTVPGFDWTWWQFLGADSSLGSWATEATSHGMGRTLVFVALAVVIATVPAVSYRVERTVRRRMQHQTVPGRAALCLAFGLAHVALGVPLGVAVALTVPSAVFTFVYLRRYHREYGNGGETHATREATLESARVYTTFNILIVAAFFVAALLA